MLDKILDFIRNNNKKATVILTVVIVIIVCVPLCFYKLPVINSNFSRIELVEIIAQIFAALFVVVGSFVALSQYYIYRSAEKQHISDERIERAFELSEYYKNNILEPYAILLDVYKKAGIYDILQKEKRKMKNFTAEEMNEFGNSWRRWW